MSENMPPCGDCGHPFDEHASDLSHPETMPCWHGSVDGAGCRPKYDDRCRNYVPGKAK
jgi:hypothetical protein